MHFNSLIFPRRWNKILKISLRRYWEIETIILMVFACASLQHTSLSLYQCALLWRQKIELLSTTTSYLFFYQIVYFPRGPCLNKMSNFTPSVFRLNSRILCQIYGFQLTPKLISKQNIFNYNVRYVSSPSQKGDFKTLLPFMYGFKMVRYKS